MSAADVVIVGCGLAAVRCARTLRARGYAGGLTIVGDEPHAAYERPALSKEYLRGERDLEDLAIASVEDLTNEGIAVHLGVRAQLVTPGVLQMKGHAECQQLSWDTLVVATGSRARVITHLADAPNVLTLRTVADADALRSRLCELGTARVGLVGCGFVGAELASSLQAMGHQVTVFEASPIPFAATLGPEVGQLLANRYRDHGVDLVTAAQVIGSRRTATAEVAELHTATGQPVEVDVVVVGVGALANDELLGGTGRGIPTDHVGRTGLPRVYAIGDVSSQVDSSGVPRRTEHWTDAGHAAVRVAHDILGLEQGPPPQPYVWSDQFGLRLQLAGRSSGSRTRARVLDGQLDQLLVEYRESDGSVVGLLGVNRAAEIASWRRASLRRGIMTA